MHELAHQGARRRRVGQRSRRRRSPRRDGSHRSAVRSCARAAGRCCRSCQKLISCNAEHMASDWCSDSGSSTSVELQQQAPDRVGRAAAIGQQRPRGHGRAGCARLARRRPAARAAGRARAGGLAALRRAAQRCRATGASGAGVGRSGHARRAAPLGSAPARPGAGRAGVTLVGDVIGRACEGVDRPHRGAQAGRAQPRRDRKVFVVTHAHGAALSRLWQDPV